MSLNIDLYKQILDAYKVSGKDGKVDSIKKSIIDNFYANPAYFEVLVNGESRDVHMLPKKDSKGQNKLLCKPDESINIGDFVEWENEMYICVNDENDNSIQCVGYITKCNNTLTFQTPDTTIHTIPCIITDRASVYSDGVENTQLISMPDGLIKIIIPNNDITNTFELLDKRLIFDHSKYSVFKVTKADKLLKKGLIEIIAKVDGYDPNKDNLELNISSYIESEVEPSEPTELIITGETRVSVWDTPQTYTVNTDKEVAWSISGDTAKIISQDGNTCKVSEVSKDRFGLNTLRVELVEDSAQFAEMEINIVYM